MLKLYVILIFQTDFFLFYKNCVLIMSLKCLFEIIIKTESSGYNFLEISLKLKTYTKIYKRSVKEVCCQEKVLEI